MVSRLDMMIVITIVRLKISCLIVVNSTSIKISFFFEFFEDEARNKIHLN